MDANTVAVRRSRFLERVHAFTAAAEPKLDDRAALVKPSPHPAPRAADAGRNSWKNVLLEACNGLDELLSKHEDVVYIGEDVEHGGYYLVSEA